MRRQITWAAAIAVIGAAACGRSSTSPSQSQTPPMSFFVTSTTSVTGNLGGLRGADALCQSLAAAAGVGSKTWRAYLSVERDADNGNRATDARSRIGNGPWVNFNAVTVAANVAELHGDTIEQARLGNRIQKVSALVPEVDARSRRAPSSRSDRHRCARSTPPPRRSATRDRRRRRAPTRSRP